MVHIDLDLIKILQVISRPEHSGFVSIRDLDPHSKWIVVLHYL